jgi:hypothetical protein
LKIDFEIVGKALKITKISNFLISGRIMKAVSQMLSKVIKRKENICLKLKPRQYVWNMAFQFI